MRAWKQQSTNSDSMSMYRSLSFRTILFSGAHSHSFAMFRLQWQSAPFFRLLLFIGLAAFICSLSLSRTLSLVLFVCVLMCVFVCVVDYTGAIAWNRLPWMLLGAHCWNAKFSQAIKCIYIWHDDCFFYCCCYFFFFVFCCCCLLFLYALACLSLSTYPSLFGAAAACCCDSVVSWL